MIISLLMPWVTDHIACQGGSMPDGCIFYSFVHFFLVSVKTMGSTYGQCQDNGFLFVIVKTMSSLLVSVNTMGSFSGQ